MQRAPRFGFNTHGQVIPVPNPGGRNVTLIAAMDSNNGIGMEGTIPWNIPEDMRQFRRLTMGHTVIMGRKTHDSLPYITAEEAKLLTGRTNIVISTNPDCLADNTNPALHCVRSLEAALELAGDKQIFIIGGGQLYKEALDDANDMILTHIDDMWITDVQFPEYDRERFMTPLTSHHQHVDRKFTFSYIRRRQKEL